jgi:ferrochelatase
MDEFAAEGVERVLIFPMFPQFSTATTASIIDAVNFATAGRRGFFFERTRNIPALRFVPPYYEHPAYIDALVATLGEQLESLDSPPMRYIFSFHGVPKRFVNGGSPYAEQSRRTVELVTERLGLNEATWEITFQSKFGPEKWLEPATDKRLEELGEEGLGGLAVACPGFVADCLETLDEMGNEGREAFEEAGGKGFHYLRCLNDHPVWLDGMAQIVREETAGWVEHEENMSLRNPTQAAYVE